MKMNRNRVVFFLPLILALCILGCVNVKTRSEYLAWEVEHVFPKQDEIIVDVEFSPDGKMLATASYDNTARVYDVEKGVLLRNFDCGDIVMGVEFSPCGKTLLTSGGAGVKLWDTAASNCLFTVNGDTGHFIFDAQVIWTRGNTNERVSGGVAPIRYWDARTGEPVAGTPGKPERKLFFFEELAYEGIADRIDDTRPDARFVPAVAGTDQIRQLQVWDQTRKKLIANIDRPYPRGSGPILDVCAISGDGAILALRRLEDDADQSPIMQFWDIRREKLLWAPAWDAFAGVVFSPNVQFVATSTYDRDVGTSKLVLLDLGLRREVAGLNGTGRTGMIRAIEWAPDGKRMAHGTGCVTIIWKRTECQQENRQIPSESTL